MHVWAALAKLSYTRGDKENMKLEEGHVRGIWEEFGGDQGTYGQIYKNMYETFKK